MEIISGIQIRDLALYLLREKTLVMADLHIGFEEALNKQGILIPRVHFTEMMKRIEKFCKGLKIERIIINGDLKDEFGKISDTEWRNVLRFLDFYKGKEIIIVQGNHDTTLAPIAEKRGIKLAEYYILGDILFCHGDKIVLMDAKVKTIIIGHEHPAISLTQGGRTEKYKCFLNGKFKWKNLIVMPSLNPVQEGSDVLQQRMLSPYLQGNLDQFEVYVVGDEILRFGTVEKIRKEFK